MANIPVERTSTGTPWWLWLLGLLLLAGLLWFLISALGDDDPDVAVVDDPVETVDPVDPVDPVTAGPVAAALDLSDLYVTRVTGDRTFFVAPSEAMSDQETLVILDQEMSEGAPGIEGQVDINPGQRVSIDGELGPLGDMDLAGMGVPDADLNAMTPDTEVVRADGDEVEVLSAPMGVDEVEVGE